MSMSYRRYLSNATSRNEFIRAATKTNALNLPTHIMRGGYRL